MSLSRLLRCSVLLLCVFALAVPDLSATCKNYDCTFTEGYANCWEVIGNNPGSYYATGCRSVCDGTPGQGGGCWCEYLQACFIG